MGIILTRHVGTGSGGASGGAFSQAEKLALEMEMEYKTAYPSYYKEFTYSQQGDLTDIDIYETDAKLVQLFSKDFTYSGQDLSQTLLTRISDGSQILKIFGYTGQDLTSITVSAGP